MASQEAIAIASSLMHTWKGMKQLTFAVRKMTNEIQCCALTIKTQTVRV